MWVFVYGCVCVCVSVSALTFITIKNLTSESVYKKYYFYQDPSQSNIFTQARSYELLIPIFTQMFIARSGSGVLKVFFSELFSPLMAHKIMNLHKTQKLYSTALLLIV